MGWARGFQVGSEAGRAMIDTYRQARQQRELRDIRQAKPEESMGYTAEQGRELEAIAGAINPETGQPYYNVEAIPGTAQFRVTPNFQVAGEQGQMQQAMPVDMAPQRVTDYLGQRYAGDLAPEQQERAQYRAMADVYAQTNPMEAARLRMSLSQDERAAKEFEQSTELRGLQIGSAQRQAKITSKIDNIIEEEEKNIATARTVFTNNGLEGGAAELKKRGLPVQFKNGAIEVLDEKGKVVERITDVNQALARVEEVIQNDMASRLASVSGDPALIRQAVQDRLANQIKQRELNIREREGEAKSDYYRAAGRYYDDGRGRETISDKARQVADALLEAGEINPNTQKPYTKEEAFRYGVSVVTRDPNARAIPKEEMEAAYTELREAADDPARIKRVKEKYPRVFGEDPFIRDLKARLSKGGTRDDGKPSIEATPSTFRRSAGANITRPSGVSTGPVENFERRSKRSALGGVNYFYYDPVTKREFSIDEYNALLAQ
jgi:hypothetical protein